jgi:hypothetical protein
MSKVPSAIETADAGFREGLCGLYPAAAKTLADEYRALFAAAQCVLASWDDESDMPIHEAMLALRAVVKPNRL